MKSIYTIGIAILLVIFSVWWFTGREDETNATPVPAVSSDFDASQQMGGNVQTPQQQGSRPQVTPSSESTAGRDVGSDSAMAAPAGTVAHSASGIELVPLATATKTIPGQPADTTSSQPSAIDTTDCKAAARTLEESWMIYDVTPTHAIAYARSRSPDRHATPTGFSVLKARLLAPLCSGASEFNQDYAATMEFVAISPDSHVRILMGDHWISDGTVLSQLSEADQEFFASSSIHSRRRIEIPKGQTMRREIFERQLARNPRALLGEP